MQMKMAKAALVAAALAANGPAAAAIIQSTQVAAGLDSPVFATGAPGDTTHLYIVEKGSGTTASIKVLDLVTHTVSTFLSISGVVTDGEQGLLGLAFDPNYATNGDCYVNYNATTSIVGSVSLTTIAEFHATSATIANPTALGTIFSTPQTDQTNHKGGWIAFSPRAGDDHNLYIAMGDGGNGNDQGDGHIEPGGNAQNTTTDLGKILRIHVDPASPNGFTIPANNPFAGSASPVKKEIFAVGVRNPFRNSFDRATGTLYIADVGQDNREELDIQNASNPGGGENYGWRVREGFISTPTVGGSKTAAMTDPILDYAHSPGITTLAGRTIIGGYVYRGSAIPDLVGTYFFADAEGPAGGRGPADGSFHCNMMARMSPT